MVLGIKAVKLKMISHIMNLMTYLVGLNERDEDIYQNECLPNNMYGESFFPFLGIDDSFIPLCFRRPVWFIILKLGKALYCMCVPHLF